MSSPVAMSAILREEVERDDRGREVVLLRFAAGLSGMGALLRLAFATFVQGASPLGRATTAGLGVISVGFLGWSRAARRLRRFPAWIPALNATIECSLLGGVLLVIAIERGPLEAATFPGFASWPLVVCASALRRRPRLAWAMGVLATVEYGLVYLLAIYPRLPVVVPWPSLGPSSGFSHGVILLAAGGLSALIAWQLNRKVEEALVRLRERDLFAKYFLGERLGVGGWRRSSERPTPRRAASGARSR